MAGKQLSEGMREDDLRDMVLPLLSVDEWKSKVDEKAVVIGFYVDDQNAAKDLNRFLQKSPVEMLDTDVSPASDQDGYFLVFVEMLNTDALPKSLQAICDDLTNLTGIKKWQMRLRGTGKILPLEEEPLLKFLRKLRRRATAESVLSFLTASALRQAVLNESTLTVTAPGAVTAMEYVDFGGLGYLRDKYGLDNVPVAMDSYSTWTCKKVERVLGEGWQVNRVGDYHVVHRGGDEAILVRF